MLSPSFNVIFCKSIVREDDNTVTYRNCYADAMVCEDSFFTNRTPIDLGIVILFRVPPKKTDCLITFQTSEGSAKTNINFEDHEEDGIQGQMLISLAEFMVPQAGALDIIITYDGEEYAVGTLKFVKHSDTLKTPQNKRPKSPNKSKSNRTQ